MKMKNSQGRRNRKVNYLLTVFFILVGLPLTFGQKNNCKDYVTLNYNNEKITGKIILNKKFWYSSIYLENKDQGIFEHYSPNQLQNFIKGDSVFAVVRVNYKKFIENGVSRRNFALLLNDNTTVKLYKSTISLGSKTTKEIFFYSKQGMNEGPVLIEDNKSSVLSAVSDCNSLKNDINQLGYEYSESYFKRLFDNYYAWTKDSTATLLSVSEKSVTKSDNISLADTSSISHSATTPIVKSDTSISLKDSSRVESFFNAEKAPHVKPDSLSVLGNSSHDSLLKVLETPKSTTSVSATEIQNSQAPLVDGFKSGDSILFEYNGFYPGQFLNHTKNGKYSINYRGMGDKIKSQNVNSEVVYKTSKHPENKSYFGYEIGESVTIDVYVLKLKTNILKPCIVIGLNKNRLILSYLMENGKERILSVDKGQLK